MGSKPFKIDSKPSDAGIVRMPNGKFARELPPPPVEIRRRSAEEGTSSDQLVREERAPDHPTPKGQPEGTEIPWGPAGPVNDADKPPMRLT